MSIQDTVAAPITPTASATSGAASAPTQLKSPFRADFVGSFLRPTALKEARAKFDAGELLHDQLTQVEDKAITQLITKIKELGYHTITDGEFRRATWHLDFMWAFEGVGHTPTKTGLPFHGEQAMIDDTYLVGKLKLTGTHPFVEHYKFVAQFEDNNTVAKQTIPAPAQFLAQFDMPFARENTRKYYANTTELVDDIVSCYNDFVAQLYQAGCRNLQLDDCTWGMLADNKSAAFFDTNEAGLARIQLAYKEINNRVIAAAPKDLTINTHVCRGNYHSTYASSGAYTPVAPVLFGQENVNAYYLEFDDERSGGFEPLAHVSGEKGVVLGLVTTKSPILEDKNQLIARIHEAAQYVPLERLYLSPQCGFASCEIGNKLTQEEQWAKLALVKEVADEVWGPGI